MRPERSLLNYTLLFSSGVGLLVLAVLLFMTGGHFVYSLDDPYIHLAIAENLPWVYSINGPSEAPSAASSSVLYPWLLMPLSHTPLAFLAPLLLNVMACTVALFMLVRISLQIPLLPSLSPLARAGAVVGLAALFNIYTLVFAGLEHSLHIATTLALLSGLMDKADGRPVPRFLWVALVLNPLFRFEGLALSGLALLFLFRRGERQYVILSAGLLALSLSLNGYYMHSMGLPWLPSSVMAKSPLMAAVGSGAPLGLAGIELLFNAVMNLTTPMAWTHVVQIVLLFTLALKKQVPLERRRLAGLVGIAALAHLLAGQFGWMDRYQAYILAANTLTILYAGQPLFKRMQEKFKMAGVLVALLVVASGATSLRWLAYTPEAAYQVYAEHAQLHRFAAQFWQSPLAANDIGYVSWQNPYPVVDVMGLASEEVRQLHQRPDRYAALAPYIKAHHADMAVLDTYSFRQYLQPDWFILAQMDIPGPSLVVARTVHFFLLNPDRLEEAKEKLRAFKATLPPDTQFKLLF